MELELEDWGMAAADGGDVMVKPPALGVFGTYTSIHCPGRNCSGQTIRCPRSGDWDDEIMCALQHGTEDLQS